VNSVTGAYNKVFFLNPRNQNSNKIHDQTFRNTCRKKLYFFVLLLGLSWLNCSKILKRPFGGGAKETGGERLGGGGGRGGGGGGGRW
jgi:hypothetical protein